MPVAAPLFESDRVVGIRLADQGTDAAGHPADGFAPGMDVRAPLTVVADGPVGPVGRQLDERFGLPPGHHRRDWAVGMKMVVDLPDSCELGPGAVIHTLGYPEPEVFGFLYVLADRTASVGVFVPSWLDSPTRTAYRTLQHWMLHPAVRRHLDGGSMRSWGAKSLLEAGRRGEPYLVGNGFARIGEGSGTTNVLTGSGVDEAWKSGTLLADGVIRLLREDRPFTAANLEETYVRPRRESWLDAELRAADGARDGFQRGFLTGLLGMGLAGLSGGRIRLPGDGRRPHERVPSLESRLGARATADDADRLRRAAEATGTPLHDEVMRRAGWPEVPLDGRLLVSQQDALLVGGKVQAAPGYADHIVFRQPLLCETCRQRLCVEICSGQAITPSEDGGPPRFDREKCVHCGACVWSCTRTVPGDPDTTNIELRAGAGGLHSVEN
jgi:electron-transferring-flavoprotein dehydrogenase